jgi:hypothetical protein
MTSEIALLNTQAVALAADSAVTVRAPGGPKVYNTANKLFMLSKHAPVGAMVFGAAEVTGVPWETVIKTFRRDLGTTRLDHVNQYAQRLFEFMERETLLFPPEAQHADIGGQAHGYCQMLVEELETSLETLLASQGSASESDIRDLLRPRIAARLREVQSMADLPGFDPKHAARVVARFRSAIDSGISAAFERYPLTAPMRSQLRRLIALIPQKDIFPLDASGLVIAGFGEQEYFPALCAHQIHGAWLSKVKLKQLHDIRVGRDCQASLIPFAQSEMVSLFMEGVHPQYRETLQTALRSFLAGLPEAIKPVLGLSDSEFTTFAGKFTIAADQIEERFTKQLADYSSHSHAGPITDVVAILPKDELAAMAEALVNLTSFKRRVTMDVETVGGPIDVAVISKGDGLVWIKRKHYFASELNPQFFETYQER